MTDRTHDTDGRPDGIEGTDDVGTTEWNERSEGERGVATVEAGDPGSPCRSGGSTDCPCARTDGGGHAESEGHEAAESTVGRRDLAKVLATVGGLTAVGSLAAPLAGLTRVFEREYTGPIYTDGTALVDSEGEPVTENTLATGERTTVFPEGRSDLGDAPTLLVRFPEGQYGGETERAFTVAGYAAYSKVCTHAGCMVAEYEDGTFVCPCHFGKFDPSAGASVVGGPPPRPLPQLPITLSSEGALIAAGDFEGPIGAGGG